jgi:hypothetical protein
MLGMGLELRAAADAARSITRAKPAVVNGDPRSLTKTKGDERAFPMKPPQRPQLVALDRGRARRAVLDPADVEQRAVEVDQVPTQIADLGGPEAVPVGEQDHGRVTMAVPVASGGLEQGLDLAGGAPGSGARRSSAASEELFVLLQLA